MSNQFNIKLLSSVFWGGGGGGGGGELHLGRGGGGESQGAPTPPLYETLEVILTSLLYVVFVACLWLVPARRDKGSLYVMYI